MKDKLANENSIWARQSHASVHGISYAKRGNEPYMNQNYVFLENTYLDTLWYEIVRGCTK